MGKKINPILFRLGNKSQYHSLWFSEKNFFNFYLKCDILIREIIRKNFFFLNISYIDLIINNKLFINIYILEFEFLNNIELYLDIFILELSKILKKNIVIFLIYNFENYNAKNISILLLNKINNKSSIKKIIKKECNKYINKLNGCKIQVNGRLDGIDIARKEWFLFGRIPLHNLRIFIDYYSCELITSYGIIGIKTWIFKKNYEK